MNKAPNNTLEILEKLIGFDTVSRNSNMALIDYIGDYLGTFGIASQIFKNDAGTKANLFATIGPVDQSGVVLSGHTDVVPIDGQPWTVDAFKMSASSGRVFGRGTTDMKGFIACALAAVPNFISKSLKKPVHLAFSYDEEIGCIGVRPMLDQIKDRIPTPQLCIIGEPTSLEPALGHKGKIGFHGQCCGHSVHSALAPQGMNAIYLAQEMIAEVRNIQEKMRLDGHQDPDFKVPYTTLHVGKISGGIALNIVPDNCRLDFEIRYLNIDEGNLAKHLISEARNKIVDRHKPVSANADITLDVFNEYPPLVPEKIEDAVRFISELTGSSNTKKVDFGTEGGLFQQAMNAPVIVCGPGDMAQGHKPDEFIEISQLKKCDLMMQRLADKLSA